MASAKSDALVGISKLEEVAGLYEQTAATLKNIARGLRNAVAGVEAAGGHSEVTEGRKEHQNAGKGHSRKRRKLSAAAKANLSRKMKAKWAERKREKLNRQAGGKVGTERRRASDPANGKQALVGEQV